MASKPTSKPAWVSDDGAAKIKEPTGSKKLTGFLKNEKPPFNFLNWLFNILSHWLNYFAGNSQYNVIIDSDTDEGDYTSLAAYIADSPVAGDRILVKVDEVLTATLSIPSDVEITQLKGNKFTLSTNFSPIIQFGNNVKTKGDFRVENSDTGTIAKGFSVNGDNNHHDNLIIENKSAGTITDGIYIEAGAEGNYSHARSINSGAGAITNDLTDNSGNDENHVTVKGDSAISRSRGANKFDQPDIANFTNAQHGHQTGASGSTLGHNAATDNPSVAHGATGAVVGTTNTQTITNKTLTTPTIADFTNANHDHGDADDGGNLGDVVASTVRVIGSPPGTPGLETLYRQNIVEGWINFNGTGTISIRDSFNVSSIVDNGTGDYDVNWDRDFADGNYTVVTDNRQQAVNPDDYSCLKEVLAGSVTVVVLNAATVYEDADYVTVIAIGVLTA